MGLASHSNVYNTCLRILRRKGYSLRVEGELSSDGDDSITLSWYAEQDGFKLYGDNPIELLGLAAIRDYVSPKQEEPYWWVVEGPDIRAELLEAAFPDDKIP